MTHWAYPMIGTPWTPENTCWHFAAGVGAARFGWPDQPMPVDPSDPRAVRRAFEAGPEQAGWQPVDGRCARAEGDAVLMAKGARPCHVGVWIEPPEGPGVLHSVEGAGVIFTPPARLSGMGFRIVGVYRRVR